MKIIFIQKLIYPKKKLHCWYFGCKPHPADYAPPGKIRCYRCGDGIDYCDWVGDTRYNRSKEWLKYWLFRKWWPRKCPGCGGRWICSNDCDELPF